MKEIRESNKRYKSKYKPSGYKNLLNPEEPEGCVYLEAPGSNWCILDSRKRCKHRISIHNSEKKNSKIYGYLCGMVNNGY